MLKHYDPNTGYSVQRVRLKYMKWDFSLAVEVDVVGTTLGFEVIEWALELHWEQLAKVGGPEDVPRLELKNPGGDVLVEEDTALLQVEWLKDFCVGGEILSIDAAAKGSPA